MRRVVALFGALALVLAGCSSGGHGQPAHLLGQGRYDGAGLVPPQPRPNFQLTDTAGKPFAFGRQTAGHPTLLFFGYTHCPDECPTTMADIRLALRDVPAEVAKKTYVVFVTTDVKRDTPAVLKQYLTQFDPGLPNPFVGLTGSQTQIDAAQVAAHVTLAEDDGQTHSAEVLLYGSDDYAHVAFLQSTDETAQISHDLTLVSK
jgi:protein SCO1/2